MMFTTDVLLARHGEFDGMLEGLTGRQPVPLNAEGRRQAEELAIVCAALGATRVLSGPQVRAVQTAADIARECRTSVELTPEMDEVDFGEWTGRPFVMLAGDPRWKRFNETRDDGEIPGGEPLAAVRQRVAQSLEQLVASARGERTVVVTHAEIIRSALLVAIRQSWSSWARFQIMPGSLTWLRYSSHAATVRAISVAPASLWPKRRGACPVRPHART